MSEQATYIEHVYQEYAHGEHVEPLCQREKIVRCRDCKQFANNIHGCYCKKSITILSDPSGFCAWGERREQ